MPRKGFGLGVSREKEFNQKNNNMVVFLKNILLAFGTRSQKNRGKAGCLRDGIEEFCDGIPSEGQVHGGPDHGGAGGRAAQGLASGQRQGPALATSRPRPQAPQAAASSHRPHCFPPVASLSSCR